MGWSLVCYKLHEAPEQELGRRAKGVRYTAKTAATINYSPSRSVFFYKAGRTFVVSPTASAQGTLPRGSAGVGSPSP